MILRSPKSIVLPVVIISTYSKVLFMPYEGTVAPPMETYLVPEVAAPARNLVVDISPKSNADPNVDIVTAEIALVPYPP